MLDLPTFHFSLRKRHSTFAILLQNESELNLSKLFHHEHLSLMPKTAVFNSVNDSRYKGYLKSFCNWKTGFQDLGEASDLIIRQMFDHDILEGFKCFPVRATAFHVPPTSIVVEGVQGEKKYQGVEVQFCYLKLFII